MNDTRKPVYVDRRPPAAKDNSARYAVLGVVTVAVIGMMAAVFWSLAANQSTPEVSASSLTATPTPSPQASIAPSPVSSPTPSPSEVVPPPAPAANELSSNDWLLSPYAIVQEDGTLTVTGAVQNLAATERSTTLRVFVYVDGSHVATATGEVLAVPGGEAMEVSLPSGAAWVGGNKVLLVTAEDLP